MSTTSDSQRVPAAGLTSLLPPALLYQLRCRPLEFLTAVAEDREIAHLGWAGSRLFFVATPELVSELLRDTRSFIKGALLKKLEIIIGRGLITLNGDEWKDARRRVQKLFHREFLRRQHDVMIRHTRHMVAKLQQQSNQTVNMDRAMNELTFNIALELFLGADPDTIQNMDELQEAIDTLNEYAKWRTWSIIPAHWKTRRNQRFREAMRLLDDVVAKVLESRLREHAAAPDAHADVLSQLMAAGFEGKALRDHAMTMLIAGHETTGTTLSFLWAHVARRPELQADLYREACGQHDDEVDLERMPLAEAVWKETLRMYPAVPILDRTAVEASQLGGYHIPAGTNVLWSPYVLQRSREYWPHRADPNAFDPYAFLNDPPPLPGAYIPFGEGPRMCLGKALADMEALTIISLLVRAFRIEAPLDEPVAMRTLVTLRPEGGVPVRLAPRLRLLQPETSEEQVLVEAGSP